MSEEDWLVTIRPDQGNPLRVEVARPKSAKINLQLQRPEVTEEQIEALRTGKASAAVIKKVAEHITSWLLAPELKGALQIGFAQRVRLVITTDFKVTKDFANVPFELTRWDGQPMLLKANCNGIVYLPDISPGVDPPATQPTFRILIVRSEPSNHAGTVPSGTELRDKLKNAVPKHARVELRLLSNEAGSDGRPTLDDLEVELAQRPRAVIYLGHGTLLPVEVDALPSPVLLFETPGAAPGKAGGEDPIPASKLGTRFKDHPVPLVVLAGCLTAAAPAENGSSHSMAEALVAGDGGVTVAIGMRYKLEVNDATDFLERLISALFAAGAAGNLDVAVKSARTRLDRPGSFGWAAPVVYRRVLAEPLFPELASDPNAAVAKIAADEEPLRMMLPAIWGTLTLGATGGDTTAIKLLDEFEQKVRARYAAGGVCGVIPQFGKKGPVLFGKPGETATVRFDLTEAIDIKQLKLTIGLGGGGTWVEKSAALIDPPAGFELDAALDPSCLKLTATIHRKNDIAQLTQGAVLEAKVQLPAAGTYVEVSVTNPSSDPVHGIVGWLAAIVVRPT